MAYVSTSYLIYANSIVGSGQCVDYVRKCAGAPHSSQWKKGEKVKGNSSILVGTAIATFNREGRYLSMPEGNHAAIYISQDNDAIYVYDQYKKKGKVSKRPIHFRGGKGFVVDDGDAYSVVE